MKAKAFAPLFLNHENTKFDIEWGADFSLLILFIPNLGRPADLIRFFQQQSSRFKRRRKLSPNRFWIMKIQSFDIDWGADFSLLIMLISNLGRPVDLIRFFQQ